MARLTISEAIRQSPIGRTSFYTKYIDTGIITVSESNQGKRYIDSSELVRVFGDSLTLSKSEHSKDNRKVTAQPDSNTSEQHSEQSLLVAQLRTQIEDLKEDKEHYRQQIKDLTLRLEPPAPIAPSRRRFVIRVIGTHFLFLGSHQRLLADSFSNTNVIPNCITTC